MLGMFVHSEDKEGVAVQLTNQHIQFTMLPSISGLSREDMMTFLIIAEEDEIESIINVFKENCQEREVGAPNSIVEGVELEDQHRVNDGTDPVTINVGGATGFVVTLDDFIKIETPE